MADTHPDQEARAAFEADAEPYGFDLTRTENLTGEPWCDYSDQQTGHRWGGFLAAWQRCQSAGADAQEKEGSNGGT